MGAPFQIYVPLLYSPNRLLGLVYVSDKSKRFPIQILFFFKCPKPIERILFFAMKTKLIL